MCMPIKASFGTIQTPWLEAEFRRLNPVFDLYTYMCWLAGQQGNFQFALLPSRFCATGEWAALR